MNLLFRALDDPTRRRILDLLGERDLSAGALANAFHLGKPTVSHHLALLRRAGLVSSRKEGQSVVYRLEGTVLDECLGWVLNLIARGKQARAAIAPSQPARATPVARPAQDPAITAPALAAAAKLKTTTKHRHHETPPLPPPGTPPARAARHAVRPRRRVVA